MSPKAQSAGLLMYRFRDGTIEVLLVHPGGPFWAQRDLGAWSIPKGEFDPGEEPLAAARREFTEETGVSAEGSFVPLGSTTQKSGKVVLAWAFQGDLDPARIKSNAFEMDWPPRSGLRREFPEVDRAAWFSVDEARPKILPAQAAFLDELVRILDARKPRR